MNDSSNGGWFGTNRDRRGTGWPGDALRDVIEQFGGRMGQKPTTTTAGRGDVRAAVLALLAEESMHGYQLIQEITDRSGGAWKPSPGSVYPTLQLLVDEGLVGAVESDGRKIYSLTPTGREAAAAAASHPAPWAGLGEREGERAGTLPRAAVDLAQVVALVGRTGGPQQRAEAARILGEARKSLFSLLAKG